MLIDKEGNQVLICRQENYHMQIYGKSGSGKTYSSCLEIERIAEEMPVLIIDFSGSYTREELEKNGLKLSVLKECNNPRECIVYVEGGTTKEEVADTVTDALVASMDICAMMQRKILMEVCESVISENGYISFKSIFLKLQEMEIGVEDSDCKKNIGFLMSRMYYIRRLDTIRVTKGRGEWSIGIHIWQLSELPERTRKILSEFILEVLWYTIRNAPERRRQIILDEFQLLRVKGTAVEEMLREGRKHGLGVTMLSQFAPAGHDEKDILEQAATSLFFSPNERNLVTVAKAIAPLDYRNWIPVLKQLERGQCVLTGKYKINCSERMGNRPIICSVIRE